LHWRWNTVIQLAANPMAANIAKHGAKNQENRENHSKNSPGVHTRAYRVAPPQQIRRRMLFFKLFQISSWWPVV
jgi:hypothetical protein